MKQIDYHCQVTANTTAREAFDSINHVSAWWAKNLEGSTTRLNDIFTVHFGETFVTFNITEFVPGKRVVWLVTDCYLHWIQNKTEWNGTKVVFDIRGKNGGVQIDFTHIGLVPASECYSACEPGWNEHIKHSLLNLITRQKGVPV